MPQITLRLSEDLTRRVDDLPGEGERSAKIRALIERGLEADRTAGEVAALRERLDELAGSFDYTRRGVDSIGKVLPKNADNKLLRLPAASELPGPAPKEFELEARGWFGRLVGTVKAKAAKKVAKSQ